MTERRFQVTVVALVLAVMGAIVVIAGLAYRQQKARERACARRGGTWTKTNDCSMVCTSHNQQGICMVWTRVCKYRCRLTGRPTP